MESQLDKWWINGTPNPKPRATKTHRKPKRPKKYIPHRDPLGLTTGQFPIEYMERVTKLIREDDPVPQMKAEANKEVSLNAAPQNVIELHKRLIHGTTKLFDVPNSISAMIRSPYMEQAHGPNDTCVFCKRVMHRYQVFCPKLKKLQPKAIKDIMKNHDITCEMCLGINHEANSCRAGVRRCNRKTNGSECKANHCRPLHSNPKGGKKTNSKSQQWRQKSQKKIAKRAQTNRQRKLKTTI